MKSLRLGRGINAHLLGQMCTQAIVDIDRSSCAAAPVIGGHESTPRFLVKSVVFSRRQGEDDGALVIAGREGRDPSRAPRPPQQVPRFGSRGFDPIRVRFIFQDDTPLEDLEPVSYTHLTLPT